MSTGFRKKKKNLIVYRLGHCWCLNNYFYINSFISFKVNLEYNNADERTLQREIKKELYKSYTNIVFIEKRGGKFV